MNTRKWLIRVIAAVLCMMVFFGSIMFYLDPLLHYHLERGPLTYYTYSEIYSNPGIAKHYDYDAVMVGTSMIENTDVDLCDQLLGTKMIRLPYSGGTSYNMKTILDICFQNNDHIKNVFWELDEFQLTNSATEPRYPLPEYLYDDNDFNDLSYLLNLDIFYHYLVKDIIGTLKGEQQKAERRGATLFGDFGEKQILESYKRPEIQKLTQKKRDVMTSKLQANMSNIVILLKNHPDTHFHFFMPPFSVLYWDNEKRNGQFELLLECLDYAMGILTSYKNVSLYFYHGEEAVISNLDNYKDYSHYGPWINDEITRLIASKECLVTKDNYRQYLSDFKDYINHYDFDALFS